MFVCNSCVCVCVCVYKRDRDAYWYKQAVKEQRAGGSECLLLPIHTARVWIRYVYTRSHSSFTKRLCLASNGFDTCRQQCRG